MTRVFKRAETGSLFRDRMSADFDPSNGLRGASFCIFIRRGRLKDLRVQPGNQLPPNRIGAIANGIRAIPADTALRLGTYFRVSPEIWLGLQLDYDLRPTRQRGVMRSLPSY